MPTSAATQPGSLEWAELTTPTIRGPVIVRFNNAPLTSFHLETETPANTTSRVMIPTNGSDDSIVIVDGRRIAGLVEGEHVVIDGVGSGLHTFERSA